MYTRQALNLMIVFKLVVFTLSADITQSFVIVLVLDILLIISPQALIKFITV